MPPYPAQSRRLTAGRSAARRANEASGRSEMPGRRDRRNAMFGPALVAGSDWKEFRVIPDILVILGQKKAPTGRETEVGKYGRQQGQDMRHVMRLKEIRVRGKRLAGPHVPAASVAFRTMAKAVQRPLARPCVSSDPYLRVGRRFNEVGGVLPTYPTLEQVVAVSHSGGDFTVWPGCGQGSPSPPKTGCTSSTLRAAARSRPTRRAGNPRRAPSE